MKPYSNCKVYGPYLRKDGRQHVIIYAFNKIRQTVSYPKYLVEIATGSYLNKGLDVHHKNGDFTDNCLDNLEIVDHSQHIRQHTIKYLDSIYYCMWCIKLILLSRSQQSTLTRNIKRRDINIGPFCSKSCSGKYGAFI